MLVKVKRQEHAGAQASWQTFEYGAHGKQTVAKILDELNYRDDLYDVEGALARRIRWECSCLQQACGGCAMVINGRPGLACGTFIDTDKLDVITLEPLTKFPVVSDLIVDRSCIAEHFKNAQMYLGKRGPVRRKELSQQYSAAKCLKCGLCLEVCPNYIGPNGEFYGAVFVNEAYVLHSSTGNRGKELGPQYKRHFARGCSKSLACRDICPMRIPTLSSIGYMNAKS